jgi:NAD(P)-dependent dehydrogenase (short-subunit alcohol dehydrogenase family)
MNKIDLKDKVAVVTGGAQGFGLAIVERLLESHAEVIIWDMDEKLLNNLELKGKIHKIVANVTNYQSVENATKESISLCGRIDILINNAGIAGPSHKTWDYPLEDWQKVIDIDLNGVFYCCKSVVPSMIDHNDGRLLRVKKVTQTQCLIVPLKQA